MSHFYFNVSNVTIWKYFHLVILVMQGGLLFPKNEMKCIKADLSVWYMNTYDVDIYVWILLSRENGMYGCLPYILIEIHKGTLLIKQILKKNYSRNCVQNNHRFPSKSLLRKLKYLWDEDIWEWKLFLVNNDDQI